MQLQPLRSTAEFIKAQPDFRRGTIGTNWNSDHDMIGTVGVVRLVQKSIIMMGIPPQLGS